MKKTIVFFCVIMLLLAGCGETPQEDRVVEGSIRYTNDNCPSIAVTPYFEDVGAAILTAALGNTEFGEKLAVAELTDDCYMRLLNGECDIVIAHCFGNNAEELLDGQGTAFDMTEIAADKLIFLTDAANTVEGLSKEELTAIFAGEITDWSELDGTSGAITLFGRNSGTAAENAFKKYFGDAEFPPVTRKLTTGEGTFETVVPFDNRTGMLGYTMYRSAELFGGSLKPLSIDGIDPSSADYPFSAPIYVAIRSSEPETSAVRLLYNWLSAEQGIELLARYFD